MASKPAINDDWEEVDDAYSVVSISSSDDEPVLVPSPKDKKKVTPKPKSPTRKTPGKEQSRKLAPVEQKSPHPKSSSKPSPVPAPGPAPGPAPAPTPTPAPTPAPVQSAANTSKVAPELSKTPQSTPHTVASMLNLEQRFPDLAKLPTSPQNESPNWEFQPGTSTDSQTYQGVDFFSREMPKKLIPMSNNPFLPPESRSSAFEADLPSRTYKGKTVATKSTEDGAAAAVAAGMAATIPENLMDLPLQFQRMDLHGGSSEDDSGATVPKIAPSHRDDSHRDDSHRDDPVYYLSTLESVGEILNDVTAALSAAAKTEPNTSRVHDMVSHCNYLVGQFRELQSILEGYSAFWRSSQPWKYQNTSRGVEFKEPPLPKDIPLDPSLHTWMTALRVKLLQVQAEVRRENQRFQHILARPGWTNLGAALEELEPSIVDLMAQMVDFLPIMMVDYSEYKTQAMTFPLPGQFGDLGTQPRAPGPSTQPPRHQPRPVPVSSNSHLARLRCELYTLKDSLYDILDYLNRNRNGFLIGDVPEFISSFDAIFATISTLLSNNGSEWIDTDLASGGKGVLSYAEFCALDPDMIRDISARLDSICVRPGGKPTGEYAFFQRGADQMGRVYDLVDDDNLNGLRAVESILTAMLMPGRE